jgi:hypothetical protein
MIVVDKVLIIICVLNNITYFLLKLLFSKFSNWLDVNYIKVTKLNFEVSNASTYELYNRQFYH